MRVRGSLALGLGFLLCLACPRPEAHEAHEDAPSAPPKLATSAPPPSASPSGVAPPAAPVADATRVTDDGSAYERAAPLSGKGIGHTSVVLKLKLEGGLLAAYKPSSKRGPERYKGEIAAYRLGKGLGLTNVPLALPRSFSREALLKALGPTSEAGALLAREALSGDTGEVRGALMPWIPHLGFVALEAEPLLSEWQQWLAGTADIPPAMRKRAAEISTLIVFDYLTANWDRWSGGNIGLDASGEHLLFIDNDGAFYEQPPAGRVAAQKEKLEGVRRFSRDLVARLRELRPARLARIIGEEQPGAPLLSDKALAGVEARRLEALRIIDGHIKKAGEDVVLSFE